MMRKIAGMIVIPVIIGLAAPAAHGWGLTGHKMVTERAIKLLPSRMQGLYVVNRDVLAAWCVEPDIRKDSDPSELPRHYIDLEQYPPNPPPRYGDALRKFRMKKLGKSGWGPWNAQIVYAQLIRAYRQHDYAAVLRRAGELSHYVADLHVPLHTTENFDGQMTGDTGVHSRWESRLVEDFPEMMPFEPRPARKLESITKRLWEIVKESHSCVTGVIEADRTNAYPERKLDGYSAVKSRETFAPVAARRLNDAALDVASFWYSAWVDAGRPRLASSDFSGIAMPSGPPKGEALYYDGALTAAVPDDWPDTARVVVDQVVDILRRKDFVRVAEISWVAAAGEFKVKVSVEDSSRAWDKKAFKREIEGILGDGVKVRVD